MSASPRPLRRAPMLAPPPPLRGVVYLRKEQCKGCELCIEFCPRDVLVRSEGFNAKGYHYPVVQSSGCINCRLCATVCPEFAIFSRPARQRPAAEAGGAG